MKIKQSELQKLIKEVIAELPPKDRKILKETLLTPQQMKLVKEVRTPEQKAAMEDLKKIISDVLAIQTKVKPETIKAMRATSYNIYQEYKNAFTEFMHTMNDIIATVVDDK